MDLTKINLDFVYTVRFRLKLILHTYFNIFYYKPKKYN